MIVETLPIYNNEKKYLSDGIYFTIPNFCKKHFNNKCKNHYSTISSLEGYYICPYGFTSYAKHIGSDIVIYTGLRVKKNCSLKKANSKIDSNENIPPVMDENEFNRQLEISEEYSTNLIKVLASAKNTETKLNKFEKQIFEISKFLSNTLHEVRKLNTIIKQQTEDVIHHQGTTTEVNYDYIKYRIENIFATSSLITIRLNSFDIIVNPELITSGIKKEIGVYDKFFKTKHCLDTYFKNKNLKVTFIGNSFINIRAYEIFEILPFLIFENAIKYSPENYEVKVYFNEKNNHLNVQIDSFGPIILDDEKEKVFENDYRGKNAIENFSSGSGVGLFLAKKICDLHKAVISIESDQSNKITIESIDYSICSLKMSIPKNA